MSLLKKIQSAQTQADKEEVPAKNLATDPVRNPVRNPVGNPVKNPTVSNENLNKRESRAVESVPPLPGSTKKFTDTFLQGKVKLHQDLIQILLADEQNGDIGTIARQLVEQTDIPLSNAERDRMIQELVAEANGFGPIDSLLNDDQVSEVMVNGPNQVYAETRGKLYLTEVKFLNDEHVMRVIEKIISPLGRRIDETSPMVDARLPDGSRVNAIIPPLSLRGPSITIRKFTRDPLTVDDLIMFGTMSPNMAQFLETCVKARLNIVVSGGTGSGKTSTLNVVSSFIPSDERIITIEDAAELRLQQEHVLPLEAKPANIEGKGEVTIRDLVKNSLRMRPNRIIVGECRSGETLDMLQAMNTGHDGSLTTTHANSPRDCIRRLEVMVLMAGMDLPLRAIREQIASAIDLIVHQERLRDGSRKITKISEIMGMEGDTIVLQDLFVFEETDRSEEGNVVGYHHPTGVVPSFIERLQRLNMGIDYQWFQPAGSDQW